MAAFWRVTEPSRNGVDESRAITNNPEIRLDGTSARFVDGWVGRS